MKNINCFAGLLFLLFTFAIRVHAQNVEIYEGMTWYLKKSVALDSARTQGKQVFLLWGRNTCSNCTGVKKRLAQSPLKPIVDENYILWFSDVDENPRNSADVSDYLSKVVGSITLPAICIIDPNNITVAHGLITGAQYTEALQTYLNQYVANDLITEKDATVVFVSGNQLVVKNEVFGETIRVYTLSGSLVDTFNKTDVEVFRSLPADKGVLIVTGSSGWTRKVVVH